MDTRPYFPPMKFNRAWGRGWCTGIHWYCFTASYIPYFTVDDVICMKVPHDVQLQDLVGVLPDIQVLEAEATSIIREVLVRACIIVIERDLTYVYWV